MPRTLIAGNWKMNGLRADLSTLRDVAAALPSGETGPEVLLCVPATLIASAADAAAGTALLIGGQACHSREKGAHTGDLSAVMLKDACASHVIVGHSERRADHGETSAFVAEQAAAAIAAGLTPIICVGETLGEREEGQVSDVISRQVAESVPVDAKPGNFVVAYEPVWAIGTGRVAGPEQIAEVHALIRSLLTDCFGPDASQVRILYGGSMNPANAAEILQVPNVNGGLIGGASLKAADFLSIFSTAAGR